MTPCDKFLRKLSHVSRSGTGWSARCPAHRDSKPSLSVAEGHDGRVLVHCHTGCATEDVVSAVDMTMRDLMPAGPADGPEGDAVGRADAPVGTVFASAADAGNSLDRTHGSATAIWEYHDAHGALVGYVGRWDRPDGNKEIRPLARHPDGWRIGAMPEPRPLYGLPSLANASVVVVTEGEKAADAARTLGFTATTSAGGAEAAEKTDWRPLAGKQVWVLPDNDAQGRKYAETVAAALGRLVPAAEVKLVELPGLPDKGDVADWIAARGPSVDPKTLRAEVEALAAATEAEPAAAGGQEYVPFPVDVLPEPVRRFVAEGAAAIGCDPSYIALPLIACLASCIGMTRKLMLKPGWYVPPVVWAAVVGESGTAKSPAFRLVLELLREHQRKAFDRYGEAQKVFDAAAEKYDRDFTAWTKRNDGTDPPGKPTPPVCERFIVSDTTVEALAPILLTNPRGLLLACDELAGWFGSFDRYAGKGKAGGDASKWLSMYIGESVVIDRKTGVPPVIHIPEAAVSVCGGIQPGVLRRALGRQHRENGLAPRLLLACPPRRQKRWTTAAVDPLTVSNVAGVMDALLNLKAVAAEDGRTVAALVKLTPEARAVFAEYYDAHNAEQLDLAGDLAAAWSKLEETPARLALVVHFVRWAAKAVPDELVLDADSMRAGIALTAWFKGEARRVYGMMDETDDDRDDRRLAEWLRRRGSPVTAREVRQRCRWLTAPGAAEVALDRLAKVGRGRWAETPTTPKGGRPGRVFVPASGNLTV